MSVNIRYPNITGRSEKEQLTQIKSYLHQLVDNLNYALPNLGTGGSTASTSTTQVQGGELSYYELRSLIIQEIQKLDTMFEQLSQKVETDVDEAVETSLREAKESGEFDGKDGQPGADGKTPVKGEDYFTEDEISSVSTQAAQKISFTLDADGNLYYEVEE